MDLPDEVHQEVRAVAGFAYGAVGADIHVFGDGTPVYLLYARDTHGAADTLRRDSAWLRAQPSRMLDARSEIVEFTGREAELARLREWRELPARSAVRWLHGPGGAGKSRLAARFAAECADAGWLVVDAVHGTDTYPPAQGSQDLRTDHRAGVLLLVDYADRWPDAHLRWLFHNGLLLGELPARILLIARSVRPWPALRAQLSRQRRATDLSDQPLDPLSGQLGERGRMFEAARRSFAAHYPDPAALDDLRPPYEDLARPDFGLTLAVHMAALTAVDARAGGREPPAGLAGMTAYLLDREHENWRRPSEHDTDDTGGASTAGPEDDDRRALDLARTVFTAVLTGPMRRDAARPLLDRLLLRTPADRVLTAHAVHYPPTDPAAARTRTPAPRPARRGLPGPHPPRQPRHRLPDRSVVRDRDHPHPPARRRGRARLDAPRPHLPHRRGRTLAAHRSHRPLPAAAPRPRPRRPGRRRRTDLDRHPRLRGPRRPGGHRAPAAPGRRTGGGRSRGTGPPARHPPPRRRCGPHGTGPPLRGAGIRPPQDGPPERGARAHGGGCTPREEAAEEDPAHRSSYADALLNLGGRFLHEIAAERRIHLLQEAIGLMRENGDAPAVLGALAQAHTRLALALWEARAGERAEESVREAERLFGEVLDRDPLLWWSMSSDVNRLEMVNGFLLAKSGHPQEAAEGAGAVVAYVRQMADLDPARYGDDLAGSLGIQSLHLWSAGRYAEAVDALLEALHLYRQLREVGPHYRDVLVDRLDDAAARLISLGRHTEAVAIVEESLALHRERLALDPDTAGTAETERGAIGRALVYLRERRAADRLPWSTPAEMDEAAEQLVRAADPAGLWDLMRAVPVTDAIRIAHRHPAEHWAPTEDGPGRRLAARLTSRRHRPQAAERVARSAAARAVWRLPHRDGPVAPDRVSFAPGAPVMTWETYRPSRGRPRDEHTTRIDVYDLASRSRLWSADHLRVGTDAVTCLGPDAVLALRTDLWFAPELVLYRPGRAEVLASGPDLVGARTFATARGFVVLLRSEPAALVGAVGRPLERIDLRDLGLERCTVHAVDPSGHRLLLAGDRRVILTDEGLEPLSARGWWGVPEQHGTVRAAAFLSPDEFVTAASTGGLYLFQQESDQTMVTAWNTSGRSLEHLFAVPGWRVVGGRARGDETTYFSDSVGLAPGPEPRPLAGPSRRAPRLVTAPPGGRHVLHGSAVHDLGDPLSFAGRPPASLTAADRAALNAYLDSGRAPYAAIRELLELVRDLGSPL